MPVKIIQTVLDSFGDLIKAGVLEITADGRKWVPALSRIEGETLVVWADGVDKPAHVRYCWRKNPGNAWRNSRT